jgi:hypothetical protein
MLNKNYVKKVQMVMKNKKGLKILKLFLIEWKEVYTCKDFDLIFNYPCHTICNEINEQDNPCKQERDELIDSLIKSLEEKLSNMKISLIHPFIPELGIFPIDPDDQETKPSKAKTIQN